jgi:RNA polymerase subunit RPABC4/transcription elongation factor Spt4
MEDNENIKEKRKEEKLEKIQLEKLRGRVIIINPQESEFAKKLGLTKKADYTQKKQ